MCAFTFLVFAARGPPGPSQTCCTRRHYHHRHLHHHHLYRLLHHHHLYRLHHHLVTTRLPLSPPPSRNPPSALPASSRLAPAMVRTRSSSRAASRAPDAALTPRSPKPPSRRGARRPPWAHAPSRVAVLWMAVSLPLVAWDTLFVLLRPHTFDGGRLHWPIWVPYKLYGHVDNIYGRKAFDARNGFTAAQALTSSRASCTPPTSGSACAPPPAPPPSPPSSASAPPS